MERNTPPKTRVRTLHKRTLPAGIIKTLLRVTAGFRLVALIAMQKRGDSPPSNGTVSYIQPARTQMSRTGQAKKSRERKELQDGRGIK